MSGGSGIDTISYTYSTGGGWDINLATAFATGLSGSPVERIYQFENAWGSQGNDRITGTSGANNLEGERGNDTIYGGGGNDTLQGENGNDRLDGGSGNDRLIGGPGNDTLIGGTGEDTFIYRNASESSGSGDLISGFDGAGIRFTWETEDRIDLSAIDADLTVQGNQQFVFLGERSDTEGAAWGPRALWVHNSGTTTYLHGNVNGDGIIDLTIRIADGNTTADDYWSGDFYL